jgi:hypothetical protein
MATEVFVAAIHHLFDSRGEEISDQFFSPAGTPKLSPSHRFIYIHFCPSSRNTVPYKYRERVPQCLEFL